MWISGEHDNMDEIVSAIESSDLLVAALTSNYDHATQREVSYGRSLDKRVVFVAVEPDLLRGSPHLVDVAKNSPIVVGLTPQEIATTVHSALEVLELDRGIMGHVATATVVSS